MSTRVEVAGGEYAVIIEGDGGLRAERYGEAWRDLTGDKLVFCLAFELNEAREQQKKEGEAVNPNLGQGYEPTMDIYAKPGTKVRFRAGGGYKWQKEDAENAGFVKNEVYTVKRCDIGHSHTDVLFDEIPGRFNSCLFADVSNTPPASAEAPAPDITLTAAQLKEALELVAPDFDTDEDQREQEVSIQHLPARMSTDGEPMPEGLYCWLTEYPEEGCIPLDGKAATPTDSAVNAGAVPSDAMREALTLAREYVWNATQRMYDGTNGQGIRDEAKRRLALIDAALAPKADSTEPLTDPSQPWTVEHLRNYPAEALKLLNRHLTEAPEVSDAEIETLVDKFKVAARTKPTALNAYGIRLWDDLKNDLRALLALRPKAQPMTDEQIVNALEAYGLILAYRDYDHDIACARAVEAAHGITSSTKGDGS